MRYLALVTDYDGTLASNDKVSEDTIRALERLRASGRRVILLTGRRLDDLLTVCPYTYIFDCIVAENGAVIYEPGTRNVQMLANPPSKQLVQALQRRGVEPLDMGEVVLATVEQHRVTAQDVISELGLEAQVICNRGAVMILPAGINKATGLHHALQKLGLSRHEVVGIGDAENDHSYLASCECAVAVANAIPSIQERVAFVTQLENGAGVRELIEELVADDLRRMEGKLFHHFVLIGNRVDGSPVSIAPYGLNILIAGPSSSGKSTLTAGIAERLIAKDYQVCIVDPEGDYGTLHNIVGLGNRWREPGISEILAILEDSKINLAINLLGIPLEDRPDFFVQLAPQLQAMRARTGRPHWLVVDEAHHMLPTAHGHTSRSLPRELGETILVTVHPDHVSPVILSQMNLVIAIGHSPEKTLGNFAAATNRVLNWPENLTYKPGHVVAWFIKDSITPFSMCPQPGRAERIRHLRKYAEGNLRWHSFYFRGPEGRQNLRAQNLVIFSQLAEGIDEETWMFHLHRGDFSRWFRYSIRDDFLASEVERIECRADLAPWQTRQMIRELINARYTLPEC